MIKKIFKMIIFLVICLGCIAIIILFELECWPVGSSLGGLVVGIIVPFLKSSFVDIMDTENWKTSQRKLVRKNFIKKTDNVRISFAYLFRIKVNGRYFLVKNARGTEKYQPVGGVYKMDQAEAQYLKTHYFVEDDHRIPINQSSKRDYRLQLQDKYIRRFVRRFNKTKNREVVQDLSREFKEELFDTGILNASKFGVLRYNYCGRHMTELQYSEHFQCYELLLADVVDVDLTANQEQEFLLLLSTNSDKYCFATEDEIKSLGVRVGSSNLQETIADHTTKILQQNTQYLTKKRSNRSKNEIEIQL
ncbi:hypothetical protein AN1V17_27500 [Vallitalea sediminicola]